MDTISARKMLRYANPIPNSSVLVRREAVIREGGFREDIRQGEDWEMWFRLRGLGQFESVPEPLTYYYVYPNSLSADPEKMIDGLNRFIDTTLLRDLRGVSRWIWRRRIRATQLCSAAMIARDNGLESELRYMVDSLQVWPSLFWQPRRFLMFAVSIRNYLHRPDRVG